MSDKNDSASTDAGAPASSRTDEATAQAAVPGGIAVLRPGMLASVQDLGRWGQRERGICPGGALDTLGLVSVNRLVGNPDDAAGIEITLGACELRFDQPTRIALAGADFGARLDDRPLRPLFSMPVEAGQVLRLRTTNEWERGVGLRSWLAVSGGIDVPSVLGSRSTDLKAGFGGHQGRALQRGDQLALGPSPLSPAQRARTGFGVRALGDERAAGGTRTAGGRLRTAEGFDPSASPIVLRVMRGPEFEQFDTGSRELVFSEHWRLTPQSSRMGSRLEGRALARSRSPDMLSSGVVPGTIQVPPNGQPIILMGDAQTTGGYPRIGAVIRADLWKLARAPIGARLWLQEVDAAAALAAWQAQQAWLASLAQTLRAMGWPAPPQNLPADSGVAHAD